MSSYAAAMAADAARRAAAQKRNIEQASLHGDAEDDVAGAWDSVFDMGQSRAAETVEEARRRKQQKKSEKRAGKRALQRQLSTAIASALQLGSKRIGLATAAMGC